MSETPTETPPEPETPTPTGPEPTPTEPEPEPETPGEAPPETPAAPASETDVEIDAIYTKLETRAKNYVKSVGEILEGGNVPVALCEMCSDAFPGMRWQEPADEVHAAMIAVSGSAGAQSPLSEDPDAQVCARCNGFGWVKLPSRVPGNEQRLCKGCNGAGYLDANPQSGALQAPAPPAENGTTELLPGVAGDDPSVVDLRARGYTIIPPMQIQGAEPVQT